MSVSTTDKFLETFLHKQTCSVKKVVLKNLEKFTKKDLCQSLFFGKVVGLRPLLVVFRFLLIRKLLKRGKKHLNKIFQMKNLFYFRSYLIN